MLTLSFPPKSQTRTLRDAGLTVADLRSAGFTWHTPDWTATDTPEAQRVHDAVRMIQQHEEHAGDPALGGSGTRRVVISHATQTECAGTCGRPIRKGEECLMVQLFEPWGITTQRFCRACWTPAMAMGAA